MKDIIISSFVVFGGNDMFEINVYTISIVLAILFILIVIDLVKKNKLIEKYSILWMIFSVVVLVFAIVPEFTIELADFVGIVYAPALLFLAGILFLLFYVLYLTKVISKQEARIVKLTQEIAILKEKVEK